MVSREILNRARKREMVSINMSLREVVPRERDCFERERSLRERGCARKKEVISRERSSIEREKEKERDRLFRERGRFEKKRDRAPVPIAQP